ncbi:aromatic ring-hydroxylating oxygenase subunit alpha [Pseudalkalibacillus decolorationis]|uniref:aromatic ring-hydroxylating oxygenase subunit alpha n=1 Tax=Pseudalkalibacillus decolorationis TaxID=163879 RepID=UPI00214840FF|nr:SRPBCC family protein [Pseudalkalibacillus decolorationis]
MNIAMLSITHLFIINFITIKEEQLIMTVRENEKVLEYTLPYKHYVDPQILDKEKKNIFFKNWILAGHASQVEKEGDFFTFEVVGESLIVSRDKNNKLNAFYNICPHRGTKVERSEQGNKKVFMCSYHGWTFQLDGKLNRAPNFDNGNLGEHSCMTHVKLEVYKSLIFVNLDKNARPLSDSYEELVNDLDKYTFLDSLKKVRVTQRMVNANWKAIVDNYLECDHCKIAHPAFSRTFDMNNYNIDTHKNYSCQYSQLKKGGNENQAHFYWIWPNLMVSIYPGEEGNMTTSTILPISPDQSLAIYSYYFRTDEITEEQEELIKFVDQVREEDFELVELLQTGFNTQAFKQGIYSPTEHGLRNFHQRIKEAMIIE